MGLEEPHVAFKKIIVKLNVSLELFRAEIISNTSGADLYCMLNIGLVLPKELFRTLTSALLICSLNS